MCCPGAGWLMAGELSTRNLKIFRWTFSDRSLTMKAYLNAVAAFLDYGAQVAAALLVTPFVVRGLGSYFYGMWQLLNRLVGYVSPGSGRPTQALKFALAHQQSSTDAESKRLAVGSAVVVWALFLPIVTAGGAILTWAVPGWLGTAPEHADYARWTVALLVFNLALGSLTSLPQSVLQGENLGYKRMGLSALFVFVGSSLVCAAVFMKLGIVGVAGATVAGTAVTGVFFHRVARKYAPWYGMSRPPTGDVRKFFGLSWYFMIWSLVIKVIMASDVVVLGFLNSVESVTTYTLTKYTPETLVSIIAIMIAGIVPGLGGVLGSGDLRRAAQARHEIMSLSWLIVTGIGATILVFNRTFVSMWVGPGFYAGTLADLLIVTAVVQLVFIRNDSAIIDVSLDLRRKVAVGSVAAAASVTTACIGVRFVDPPVVGLSLGLIVGRAILSVSYPRLINQMLGSSRGSQFSVLGRPVAVTGALFVTAAAVSSFPTVLIGTGIRGWAFLAVSAGLICLVFMIAAFYAGLDAKERRAITRRMRALLNSGSGN